MSLVGFGLDSVPLVLTLQSSVKPQEAGWLCCPFLKTLRAGGLCIQVCQYPWMLRPLTFCFSQTTNATTALALTTGGWPVPPSQATNVNLGLCSTPTAIACPAQSSQSWEEATPTVGTPGARWKARGALHRIKMSAWNCVTYPRVVCILSLYMYI